jgi:UDP-glucose 4-epimerase
MTESQRGPIIIPNRCRNWTKLRAFRGDGAEERAYSVGRWLMAAFGGDYQSQKWCQQHGVQLADDKGRPINAMGISKAMMEKVIVAKSRSSNSTVICTTRYGNVMASRGSVIPLLVNQIRDGQPITITDPAMTRFMMTLDDAVKLVLYAFEHGKPGEIFVQKAPAATIETLDYALTDLLGKPEHEVRVIGTRHGEKLYETLLSREEMVAAEDLGGYYRVPPDMRDLNYGKFVEQGEVKISEATDYNSHNTDRLDIAGMQALLMKLPFMQAIARGEHVEPEE